MGGRAGGVPVGAGVLPGATGVGEDRLCGAGKGVIVAGKTGTAVATGVALGRGEPPGPGVVVARGVAAGVAVAVGRGVAEPVGLAEGRAVGAALGVGTGVAVGVGVGGSRVLRLVNTTLVSPGWVVTVVSRVAAGVPPFTATVVS